MKVILLSHIKGIGRKDDIKDVPDGYANNFLLPKKLAVVATTKEMDKLNSVKLEAKVKKEVHDYLLTHNLAELKDKTITITRKANKEGHLFQAIKEDDIVKSLHDSHKLDIEKKYLGTVHIKNIGTHTVPIKVEGKEGSLTLIVEAE